MSTDPCCPLQSHLGWVAGVMNIIVHNSANPEVELHQAALPSWHVGMKFDCAVFLLKPTTDSFFEPGYSLTQVRVVHGEASIDVSPASVIAPNEEAIYHFYYTGVSRADTLGLEGTQFSNSEAFGIKPALGFR